MIRTYTYRQTCTLSSPPLSLFFPFCPHPAPSPCAHLQFLHGWSMAFLLTSVIPDLSKECWQAVSDDDPLDRKPGHTNLSYSARWMERRPSDTSWRYRLGLAFELNFNPGICVFKVTYLGDTIIQLDPKQQVKGDTLLYYQKLDFYPDVLLFNTFTIVIYSSHLTKNK